MLSLQISEQMLGRQEVLFRVNYIVSLEKIYQIDTYI